MWAQGIAGYSPDAFSEWCAREFTGANGVVRNSKHVDTSEAGIACEASDKDEHIGEVSIARSRTGLREFAREEIGIKAAAGGR